jgi:hypothetical protein
MRRHDLKGRSQWSSVVLWVAAAGAAFKGCSQVQGYPGSLLGRPAHCSSARGQRLDRGMDRLLPELSMTVRSLESRIVKLEAGRQRPNEVLLVWRRPDADIKAATSGTKFAPGDRVICAEWFGDGPLPAPRWYREWLLSELDAVESG